MSKETTDNGIAWIAADWGTSHLRLWLMDAEDCPIERIDSDSGMGRLSRRDYEPTLMGLIGDRLGDGPMPVLVCGMAGAKQGWTEAPYAAVPCTPPTDPFPVVTADTRLKVHILPGVKQTRPADVMRGEETQIGGFLAKEPRFDGVLCLPGTHTKWVHISAQEIVSFRTFMTGELFSLLGTHSVLRHGLADPGWDEDAFAEAVGDTLSRPASLAASLFGLRADGLLNGTGADVTRARLSGFLIGAELSASRPYWLGQEVVVLGEDDIARAYETALQGQGVAARRLPAGEITLQGLVAAYRTMKETQ